MASYVVVYNISVRESDQRIRRHTNLKKIVEGYNIDNAKAICAQELSQNQSILKVDIVMATRNMRG